MNTFEGEHVQHLQEVKFVLNEVIDDDKDLMEQFKSLLATYTENTSKWTKMQRSTYIMRMFNFLLRKYRSIMPRKLLGSMMCKVHEIFELERFDFDFLDYLARTFPIVYVAYDEANLSRRQNNRR